MIKVSAIVPVYNPGTNIDRCIETLVGQSLPSHEYEVVFVDDGSTDATPERLDRLAEEHEHVRVEHIPNSGWPGKPRNVGIEMARGEFVYFVDNDDHVGHQALERLYERATALGADVVMGKVVGQGKPVPRALFTRNRDDVTLEWPPLIRLLAPHKLFRKSLLDEHGIRFPEGRRRLEDHVFTMHAYFHARRIAILADYPCYYWVRNQEETENASYQVFDAPAYYDNVREVLDLVVEHTEPGPLRDRLLAHWYRGKMLGRVGGRWFPERPPQFRRELYDAVHELAQERYGPETDRFLAPNLRVRSYLLREGTFDDLSALGHWEAAIRADVRVTGAGFAGDGALEIRSEGRLLARGDAPLLFEARGERLLWAPPEVIAGRVPEDVRNWTDAMRRARSELMIRAFSDHAEFVLPGEHETTLEPAGDGLVTPVVRGVARVEPWRAAAGSPAAAGRGGVLGSVTVCGFSAVGRARSSESAAAYAVDIGEDGSVAVAKRSAWSALKGHAARRLPRLARAAARRA
jgi:poly(ribitol-phosphate) beta-N-acetylglucosaminyltransferase